MESVIFLASGVSCKKKKSTVCLNLSKKRTVKATWMVAFF